MNPADCDADPGAVPYTGSAVARGLELLAVWVVSMSTLGLIALRLGVFSAPQIWLGAIGATAAYQYLTRRRPIHVSQAPLVWQMTLVLSVGLFFRLTPYAYMLGGQDQGLYVNMAMELVRTGGLHPTDQVLATLADPTYRHAYLAANYTPTIYLPGVYTSQGGLVFQFYHLFPVWLALFEMGGGPDVAVYGLVFLSLLSLLFFQWLTQLLTGSSRIGMAAGLLLAVNPLHAFFSKFPLTEVPTLGFSAIGLTFLALYWRNRDPSAGARLLLISAAGFGMVFATRVSGFMYMPFVLVVFACVQLFETSVSRRNAMSLWALAVIWLYAVSVLYGLKWSEPYVRDIYRQSFEPLLGENWWPALRVAIGSVAIVCAAIWAAVQFGAKLGWPRRAVLIGRRALPFLAVALVGIALYKAYRLGFTDTYAQDAWLGARLNLSHQGWRAFFSASLPAATIYLSPFVVAAFFIAAFRRNLPPELAILLFFTVCFLGHICVLQWYLPYQPYYARYLVSEAVPYLLLFAVCGYAAFAADGWFKSLLALGGLWCFALSVMQLGKNENEGTKETLDRIAALADRGDIVLLDESLGGALAWELQTPLVYSYGLNTSRVNAEGLCDAGYLGSLDSMYDDVYLLSTGAAKLGGFEPIESVRLLTIAFTHGAMPPTSTTRRYDMELVVRRYQKAKGRDCALNWRSRSTLGAGWSGPESWGVWTNAVRASISVPEALLSDVDTAQVLVLQGRMYTRPGATSQRIRVLGAGRVLAEATVRYPESRVTLSISLKPLAASGSRTLQIETPDAISPRALGESSDGRKIAFGLESMTLR